MASSIKSSPQQNQTSSLKQEVSCVKKILGWSVLAGVFAAVVTTALLAYYFAKNHFPGLDPIIISANAGLSVGCAVTLATFVTAATIFQLRKASQRENNEMIPLESKV